MFEAPAGYREVAQSTDRAETVYMSLGINIDNTAADDLTGITGNSLPMSNGLQLTDATYEIETGLATFEADGIPTASGSRSIIPPILASGGIKVGWWGGDISDSEGNVETVFTVALSAPHTSAFTIYTDGPSILEGEVIFSLSGEDTTVPLVGHSNSAVASGSETYDSITVRITRISEPYKHVRITEIEFGDSVTISTSTLANEITYIDEIDPLYKGLPMRELDFELINVNGEYDEDNPNTLFTRLAIGNPINLSYMIMGNGTKYTIPMGRFVLAEKRPSGNNMAVVAYDIRWHLSRVYLSWGISASESIGATLDRLLTTVEIPHDIDSDVYSIYPVSDYTFGTDNSVLDNIQAVIQAYGLTFIPDRYGSVIIGTTWASDDYGLIPPTIQFSWPETAQLNRYNFIDIIYGTGVHYQRDLRGDPNTARIALTFSNQLIVTQAQAEALCNRVVAHLYSKAVMVEWASDPVADLYDSLEVYSMWTLNQTPSAYKAVKREITFNGMLKETTTLVQ